MALGHDSKVYRYSEEHEQFYQLFDGGDLFGYAWGAVLADGHLLVSGWGKSFVRIDLARCPPAIPRLSLRSIAIDGGPADIVPRYILKARSVLAVDYLGIDRVGPDHVRYQTRIAGLDTAWSEPTRHEGLTLRNLPSGSYRLEVRCRGESGVWGEPIGVDLEWRAPWYATLWARSVYGVGFVGLLASAVALTRRQLGRRHAREMAQLRQEGERRILEAQKEELERELRTAHDMQMALMPHTAPVMPGYQIAGRCVPSNHVGGDLFKYYRLPHGRFAGVLADVSGHGMEAAVPLLVFSGLLESQLQLGGTIEDLTRRLNASLCKTLTGRTFICLLIAELQSANRRLRLVNAGCPHPYHYQARSGRIAELQTEAYPLGVRRHTAYQGLEVQLEAGDWVVVCSDGIVEAANGAGEVFGYERLAAAVAEGCAVAPTAMELLAGLLAAVRQFSGGAVQGDDQTLVVLKVDAEGRLAARRHTAADGTAHEPDAATPT